MNPITEYVDTGNVIIPFSETPQALGISQYQQYKQPEYVPSSSKQISVRGVDTTKLEDLSNIKLIDKLYSILKIYERNPSNLKGILDLDSINYILKERFDSNFDIFLDLFTSKYKYSYQREISIDYILENLDGFFGEYTYSQSKECLERIKYLIEEKKINNDNIQKVLKFFIEKNRPFEQTRRTYKEPTEAKGVIPLKLGKKFKAPKSRYEELPYYVTPKQKTPTYVRLSKEQYQPRPTYVNIEDEPTYVYRNQPYEEPYEEPYEQEPYEQEKKKGYSKIKKIPKPAGPPTNLLKKEKPKKIKKKPKKKPKQK